MLTFADASTLTFRRDSNASTGERQVRRRIQYQDNAGNNIYYPVLATMYKCAYKQQHPNSNQPLAHAHN